MFAAESPVAPSPSMAASAGPKSFVDIHLRYKAGIKLSLLGIRRRYLGRMLLVNLS